MSKKPHILIFNPDQMRTDSLAHMGNAASYTPNLDKMTQEGVSFSNAFCQNPVCTPSRCSFMSGWYPHVRGHRTMTYMMHEDEPVLLKELKDEGYYVWMNARNDLLPAQHSEIYKDYCNEIAFPENAVIGAMKNNEARGKKGGDNYYSHYRGIVGEVPEGKDDMDTADVKALINLIERHDSDEPLCMFLALGAPHPPYATTQRLYDLIKKEKMQKRIPTPDWSKKPSMTKGIYDNQGLQNWTEDRWDELRAVYLGMCAYVDELFGQVVDALKKAGIYDDTAIFFFSDHGDYTGDYGLVEKAQNTFEDCLTKVPFIVKPPKDVDVKPGVNDALVELVDFYATAEDFSGIKPTHSHYGKSLRKVISGQESQIRDAVFCEGGRLNSETHCMETGGTGDLNESSEYYPRQKMQCSDKGEHGRAIMCRTKDYKYVKRMYEMDELYDLKADPSELDNRIDDPQLSSVLTMLKDRAFDWLHETCDVVPFEQDQRMFNEKLISIVRSLRGEQAANMLAAALKNGMSLQDIMKNFT